MRRPYVVVLGENFPRAELLDFIDKDARFGCWFFSMPNSFFVYSSIDANTIDAFIQEKIGSKYRYFVSEVNLSNYQGWMPKSHWAIFNNKGVDRVYDLTFNGYYKSESSLPHDSGIYCVHGGVYNATNNSVQINQLLYIGCAKDINQRHTNHENKPEWQACCSLMNESLWFSYAIVAEEELERCEAALIFLNQPRCNKIGKEEFRQLDTIVNIKGSATLLLKGGLVEKTASIK